MSPNWVLKAKLDYLTDWLTVHGVNEATQTNAYSWTIDTWI